MNKIPTDCILEIFSYLDIKNSYNYYNYLNIKSIDNVFQIKNINYKDLLGVMDNISIIFFLLKFSTKKSIIEKYIVIFSSPFTIIKLVKEKKLCLTLQHKVHIMKNNKGFFIKQHTQL
jgi:hypothetical protein|tara:strand:+ start:247 stop:600 length:354 start_codon:yes stop_codon:yes gene_type:complete